MTPSLTWSIAIALAYLLGSVPVGLLMARSKGIDLRAVGSGNIGATNAMRALGKRLGLLCFILDLAKGAIPTLLTALLLIDHPMTSPDAWRWLAVAGAAVAGHMFPVWLRFKGGKGVATGFGALLGMWPILTIPALLAMFIWMVSLRLTRYVGVSSCIAALSIPPLTWATLALGSAARVGLLDEQTPVSPFLIATACLAAFVVIKHRGNLSRTLAGTEHRVGDAGPSSENADDPVRTTENHNPS